MPHNRFEWIDRLKFVEREHRVVATAIARLRLAILEGLVRTPDGTTPRDLVAAGENLETTYLVRLWAEFETALSLHAIEGVPGTPWLTLDAGLWPG